LLADQVPFSVKAIKDTLYGPDQDILVTELDRSAPLLHLQEIIMDFLDSENVIMKNPRFHRDGFSPHVSVYGSRRVNVGDEVLIDHVLFASKVSPDEASNTKILVKILFKG